LNIDVYRDQREKILGDMMFSDEIFSNMSCGYGGCGPEGYASTPESIDWTQIGYNFETITFDNEKPVSTV